MVASARAAAAKQPLVALAGTSYAAGGTADAARQSESLQQDRFIDFKA
jgi:hypothetical protein